MLQFPETNFSDYVTVIYIFLSNPWRVTEHEWEYAGLNVNIKGYCDTVTLDGYWKWPYNQQVQQESELHN